MGEGLNHIPEEEIAKIEQQRLENQQRLEQTAREQNKKRPLKDKVLGRNKISSEDLMLEEAHKENINYDAVKEEIANPDIEKAVKFNKMLNEGKVSAEYLDEFLLKDQTPENLEIIVNKIKEKLQDILSPGSIYHVSRWLTPEGLENMLTQGIKSRSKLEEEKYGYAGFFDYTIFPHHVSFTLLEENVEGLNIYKKAIVLDQKFMNYMFNKYVNKALENKKAGFPGGANNRDPIRFVGAWHPFGQTEESIQRVRKIMDIVDNKGWLSKAQDGIESTGYREEFTEEQFKYLFFGPPQNEDLQMVGPASPLDDEIIIDPQCIRDYMNLSGENPIGGVVLEHEVNSDTTDSYNKRFLKKITQLSAESITNAVPVYDQAGNLIWPLKMDHEEVVAYVKERDKAKRAENNV